MARTRMVKPEFFTDKKLSGVSIPARLLFVGLWTLADRSGRLVDAPNLIGGSIFPYDNQIKADKLLAELETIGVIERYGVDGELYIQIKNFTKHQKPHPKEKGSVIPCNLHGSAVEKVVPDRSDTGIRNTDTGIQVASPTGDHHDFVEYWMLQFRERVGTDYIFLGGKDGALVKKILRELGSLDKAMQYAHEFFFGKDKWVEENGGYTIGVFQSQLNKIAQRLAKGKSTGDTTSKYDGVTING